MEHRAYRFKAVSERPPSSVVPRTLSSANVFTNTLAQSRFPLTITECPLISVAAFRPGIS